LLCAASILKKMDTTQYEFQHVLSTIIIEFGFFRGSDAPDQGTAKRGAQGGAFRAWAL